MSNPDREAARKKQDRIDRVNKEIDHEDAEETFRRIGEAYLKKHPEEKKEI